jgi:hypothetical protein
VKRIIEQRPSSLLGWGTVSRKEIADPNCTKMDYFVVEPFHPLAASAGPAAKRW